MLCPRCSASLDDGMRFCGTCGANTRELPPPDPLIGRSLLGQYTIERRLGVGGYGVVYEAEQRSLRRKAAIKVLHRHMVLDPIVRQRFQREGMAASRLEHPSAVKIYNFGETEDGFLWIAMELLQGQTLSERLKEKGSLSPMALLEVMEPVCEVLAEAHEKGITHRDLKPENIMLTYQKERLIPKVLDFGIAGIVEEEGPTKSGMISGTPPYMPPEQWRGLKYTDPRSDIYALGVICYQCLSGKLPFTAETTPDWMMQHVNLPPIPLSDVVRDAALPLELQSVIMRALSKSPEERPQSMPSFLLMLQGAIHNPGSTLPDASLQTVEQAPRQGDSRKFLLGAALCVLLFGAVIFWGAPSSKAQGPSPTSPTSEPQETQIVAPPKKTTEEERRRLIQLLTDAEFAITVGQYEGSQKKIEEAKAIDPGFPEWIRVQGQLYLAQFQTEEACATFREYLKKFPESAYKPSIVMTMNVLNPKEFPSCDASGL